MLIRNISEAKAQLSSLIEAIQHGQEVLIAKAGKPVAKLVPYSGVAKSRKAGALKGKISWLFFSETLHSLNQLEAILKNPKFFN